VVLLLVIFERYLKGGFLRGRTLRGFVMLKVALRSQEQNKIPELIVKRLKGFETL
jgi:hypothetical protein